VQADQAGNGTYLPAPSVRVTFSVNPRPASVTPNAAAKVYGTADPAFGGTLAGFLASDNVTATYSRTAGETVAGSPYTISATLSPTGVLANYSITYTTATFTINKAAATVTATNYSKTYGTSDPVLGATQTGFTAADAATITLSASRAAGEAVGTYVITPSAGGAALSNYIVSYVNGTFTINKATPTISWANPADITYGTALSGTQLNATANVPGSFTYTPPSGTVLNAGNGQTLSVTFLPTDAANYNSASKTVTINVLPGSAAQLVQTLILDVKNLKLPQGTEQSLVTKLDNALKSLQKGQKNAAANQINAFINEVNAQRNKHLTNGQADDLIAKANRIILLIGT